MVGGQVKGWTGPDGVDLKGSGRRWDLLSVLESVRRTFYSLVACFTVQV